MAIAQPATRPANPRFSSGPCAKPPTFSLDKLADAALGRSHRAAVGKDKLKAAIEGTREVLGIPADYKIGIVPASDTGAVEMAMWSMLGARHVEMLAWESFGSGWVTDVVKQLKLDATVKTADYGDIVDLTKTTVFATLPDGLCVSGLTAGASTDTQVLTQVKGAAGDVPVFVNTGVKAHNAQEQLSIADGAVIGTYFKHDGVFENEVVQSRVEELMAEVTALRS